jgi:hypothetical protein
MWYQLKLVSHFFVYLAENSPLLTVKHPPFAAGPGCTPTRDDIFRFAEEGSVFLGCVKTTTPSAAAAAAAVAAGFSMLDGESPPPPKLRAADLVKNSSETFVIMQHTLLNDGSNYYYVQATRTTWAALYNTSGAVPTFPSSVMTNRTGPPRSPTASGNGTARSAAVRKSASQQSRGHRRALQQFNDNRYRQSDLQSFPYWNIGLLSFSDNGEGFTCSATFFSPDDLLTAAHCVVDSVTGQPYRITSFVPAKDGASEPYGR